MKCALIRFVSYAEKNLLKSPIKCLSFREIVGAWLLSHLLPQKLLWWQACSVSIVGRWGRCAKRDGYPADFMHSCCTCVETLLACDWLFVSSF